MDCSTSGFPVLHHIPGFAQTHAHFVSVSLFNEYHSWFPLGLTGLIYLLCKEFSTVFSNTTIQKHHFFWYSAFIIAQLSHPYMTTGKTIALTIWTIVMVHYNTLPRFLIDFLPRSRCLLISWLQSPSAVILEPQKVKCHCFPIYLPWSDGTRCHDLPFLNVKL